MLELFIGLFPLTNSWLFNHFRSPLHLALAVFLIQVLCLYPYYHFWDRLRAKSVVGHVALGGIAAVFILLWAGILDGIGSFMLTPVEGESGWARLMNPTWVPLIVHRFFGNLVIGGYVMAAYAGWRLWKNSPNQTDQAYYLMLLKTGISIGIVSVMIQPVSGFVYAQHIQNAQPDVLGQLYAGQSGMLLVWQFTLLALLLLGSHGMFRSVHLDRGHSLWAEAFYILTVVLLIVLAVYPFYRRIVNLIVLVQTGWYLSYVFPAWMQRSTPSLNKPFMHYLAMALGLVSLLLYLTMGTIREVARGPDTVYGLIERQTEATLVQEGRP
jgi:hypothetical protein